MAEVRKPFMAEDDGQIAPPPPLPDFSLDDKGKRKDLGVTPIGGKPIERANNPFDNQIQSLSSFDKKPLERGSGTSMFGLPDGSGGNVESVNEVKPIVSSLTPFEQSTTPPKPIQSSVTPISTPEPVVEGEGKPKAKKELTKRDPKDIEADERIKTAETMSKESDEILRGVLEGDDPIREQELNQYINLMAPSNQAQADAVMLKLKQQGITDGALNSLIFNTAMAQGKTVSDAIQSINSSSANRLYEVAKWGVDRAHTVKEQNLDLKIKEATLSDTERANYDDTLDLMQTRVPGIVFNSQAYQNVIDDNPDAAGIIDSKSQLIKHLINQGTPESLAKAQEILVEMANLYPTVFGDPANYADWDPNDFDKIGAMQRLNELKAEISKTIVSDEGQAVDDVRNTMIDPERDLAEFDATWNRNEKIGDNDEIMEILGIDGRPMTDDEKLDYMAADIVWDIKRQGINTEMIYDGYFDTLVGDDKDWLMSNKDDFLQYLNDIEELVEDPETGILTPVIKNLIPPWQENSSGANLYYDWPVFTFDEKGEVIEEVYGGMNYRDSVEANNYAGADPTYAAHSQRLDREYEKYDGPLSMMDWYVETKGGTPEGIQALSDANPAGFDGNVTKDDVFTIIGGGHESMTKDDLTDSMISLIPEFNYRQLPLGESALEDLIADNDYDEFVNIGPFSLKAVGGGSALPGDSTIKGDNIQFETLDDGTDIIYNEAGWSVGDAGHGYFAQKDLTEYEGEEEQIKQFIQDIKDGKYRGLYENWKNIQKRTDNPL